MDDVFWDNKKRWPRDPPGYIFLGRAMHEVATAKYGPEWNHAWDDDEATPSGPIDDSDAAFEAWERSEEQAEVQLAERFNAIAEEIAKQCLLGHLRTALRAKRGGAMTKLGRQYWNSEYVQKRFSRCEMSPTRPFDDDEFGSHWIFVSKDSLDRYLSEQPFADLPALKEDGVHLSPYLKTMLAVAKRTKISPTNQPKKDELAALIKSSWTGAPLSKRLAEAMATLIREPDSQFGRAKKSRNVSSS